MVNKNDRLEFADTVLAILESGGERQDAAEAIGKIVQAAKHLGLGGEDYETGAFKIAVEDEENE